MTALDGKKVAEALLKDATFQIERLKATVGRAPGLAVVMVGNNPASKVYVQSKRKAAEAIGITSRVFDFPENAKKQGVIDKIWQLNDAAEIDAILVQLPLPPAFDLWEILDQVHPQKDADCVHPLNQGRLMLNRSELSPCTPAGIIQLLDHYKIKVEGMNAVVIGRSFLVGKPIALMLANRHATVTLCHSRTQDLTEILCRADLVIAATGSPALVDDAMVREGVVLVDVGINHVDNEADCRKFCSPSMQERFEKNGYALVGDIHYRAYEKASYYTPVPGGVGPMTVAMLMHNTLRLYRKLNNLSD